MDPGTTDEGCSGMTIVAIQSGCKMRRIDLGILTFCCHTIVAGSTGADDLRVIDRYYWRKGDDAMAILADRRGLNMRRILAGRVRAVVTTGAIA